MLTSTASILILPVCCSLLPHWSLACQVGVLGNMDEKVVSKGRLGPGMMISVNLETGEVNSNTDIKKRVASAYPYAEWLAKEVCCAGQ